MKLVDGVATLLEPRTEEVKVEVEQTVSGILVKLNAVPVRHWNFSRGPDGTIRALTDKGELVVPPRRPIQKGAWKPKVLPPTLAGEEIADPEVA